MSTEIWTSEDGALTVTRYCGPAGPPDRRRWQFTTPTENALASIGRTELDDLVSALLAELESRGAA